MNLKNRHLFLLLCFFTFSWSCKPRSSMELKEVGFISQAEKWGAEFSYEQAKLQTVKICHLPIFKECSSGTVVSNEGHILTAFHVAQMSGMKEKLDFSETETADDLIIVSPYNQDFNGRPIEPLVFKATYLQGVGGRNLDAALVKVNDVEYFSKVTFPAKVNLQLNLVDESPSNKPKDRIRIYVAGFPAPHLSLKQLETARETAKRSEDGVIVPDEQRKPADYEFALGTGLYHNQGFSKTISTTSTSKNEAVSYTDDSRAFSATLGSSGGGIYIQSGELVGILTRTSASGFLDNTVGKNLPNETTSGTSLIHAKNYLALESLVGTETVDLDTTRMNQIKSTLADRANELEKYLKSAIQILKKEKKQKKLNFEFLSPKKGWLGTSGYKFASRSTCNFLNQGKPYKAQISGIKVKVLDHNISKVKFRIDKSDIPIFGSSWTKWLEVPTAHILGNVVMDIGVNLDVKGVKLRGFAPFIYNPSLIEKQEPYFRYFGKNNIIGLFASAVLQGRLFESDKDPNDKYKIYQCTGQ